MLSFVLWFLFPKTCVATKKEWEYLSKAWRKSLSPHPEMCPASHRFSRDFLTLPGYQNDFLLKWIHICFYYNNELKKLILKLKYYHHKDVVDTLIERMILSIQTNKTLRKDIHNKNACLTYVPSHRRRKYIQKWYNQSELIAQALAKSLGIPCLTLARKTRYTKSQTKLSRKNRLHNIQWSFSLVNQNEWLWYRTIILVDDIVTTWSTLHELALLIKKVSPQAAIRWLTIWRHNG